MSRAGYVLAGGRSSRMGRDKALLPFRGGALAESIAHSVELAAGSVVIEVRGTGEGVEVAVRDTGSGVAPDAVEGIFDRFSRSTDSPGAGLGLAIAKGLVEAHGGTIRAYSAPGQGTRIVFSLPAADA